jgi:hypothetical protein
VFDWAVWAGTVIEIKKKGKEKGEADWAALGLSPSARTATGVGRFAVVGCTQRTSHGPNEINNLFSSFLFFQKQC